MKRELNGSQKRIATVDNFIDTDWGMLYPCKESNVLNPPLAGDTELIHANRELSVSLNRTTESIPMLWICIKRSRYSNLTGWFWYFTPERMREINLYVKAKERSKLNDIFKGCKTPTGTLNIPPFFTLSNGERVYYPPFELMEEKQKPNQCSYLSEIPTDFFKKKPEGVAIDVSVLEKAVAKSDITNCDIGDVFLSPLDIINAYTFVCKNSTPLNSRYVDQLKGENERLTTELKDSKDDLKRAKMCIGNLDIAIEILKTALSYK